MCLVSRWFSAVLALCLLTPVVLAQNEVDKGISPDRRAMEAVLYTTLRDVINRGADLYNSGDMAGCYRLFEGSLRTVAPLLEHRPELVKSIQGKLVSAERDSVTWRRAFTLRSALDEVRATINPKKAEAKKPEEKRSEEKKPEEKKPTEKEPDKEPPAKKEPPVKTEPLKVPPVEKKEPEKKEPEKKEPEKKEPEKKEPEKKEPDRPVEKKDSDKKEPEKKEPDEPVQ